MVRESRFCCVTCFFTNVDIRDLENVVGYQCNYKSCILSPILYRLICDVYTSLYRNRICQTSSIHSKFPLYPGL